MEAKKKTGRYERIFRQLEELTSKTSDPLARMSSISAVLHHKMEYYFWTGFYRHDGNRLVVGPYQGPVACQELEQGKGVCWAAVDRRQPVLVPDVEEFPGHIACDSRSRSEVALPVLDHTGRVTAVFDVDSDQKDAFGPEDVAGLQKILSLVHRG